MNVDPNILAFMAKTIIQTNEEEKRVNYGVNRGGKNGQRENNYKRGGNRGNKNFQNRGRQQWDASQMPQNMPQPPPMYPP